MRIIMNSIALAALTTGCAYESSIIVVDAPPAPITEEDTGELWATEYGDETENDIEDTADPTETDVPIDEEEPDTDEMSVSPYTCEFLVSTLMGVQTMEVAPSATANIVHATGETVPPEVALVASFTFYNGIPYNWPEGTCPEMVVMEYSLQTSFQDQENTTWTPKNMTIVDGQTGTTNAPASEGTADVNDLYDTFTEDLLVPEEGGRTIDVWLDLSGASNATSIIVKLHVATVSDGTSCYEIPTTAASYRRLDVYAE